MLSTEPRARLQELAAARATSLAALSRMIGRGPAYLQQWVRYGSPRVLAERDRRMLANFFGVSQEALGGLSEPATFRIPRLDVAASAGPGAINDEEALLALDEVSLDTARALGLQEGGYVLICALFGIPAEQAIALVLVRRLRDVILGVPGVFVWRWGVAADRATIPASEARGHP